MNKGLLQMLRGSGDGMLGLLGNPMAMAGLQLLSAGRDARIDPYQAAASGLMQAQQFRDSRDAKKLEDELAKREKWLHEQRMKTTERIDGLRQTLPEYYRRTMGATPLEGPPTANGWGPVQASPMGQMLAEIAQADPTLAIDYDQKLQKQHMDYMPRPIGHPQTVWNPETNSNELVVIDLDPKTGEYTKRKIGEGPLSPQVQTMLYEYDTQATEAENAAEQATRLADEFARNLDKIPSGFAGKFEDWMANFFGTQDYYNDLRRRQRTSSYAFALDSLPPGVASDVDVRNAFKTIPPDMGNPEQVVAYMRSQALGDRKVAEAARFKQRYLAQTRGSFEGLNEAWEKHKDSLDWWNENPYSSFQSNTENQRKKW